MGDSSTATAGYSFTTTAMPSDYHSAYVSSHHHQMGAPTHGPGGGHHHHLGIATPHPAATFLSHTILPPHHLSPTSLSPHQASQIITSTGTPTSLAGLGPNSPNTAAQVQQHVSQLTGQPVGGQISPSSGVIIGTLGSHHPSHHTAHHHALMTAQGLAHAVASHSPISDEHHSHHNELNHNQLASLDHHSLHQLGGGHQGGNGSEHEDDHGSAGGHNGSSPGGSMGSESKKKRKSPLHFSPHIYLA